MVDLGAFQNGGPTLDWHLLLGERVEQIVEQEQQAIAAAANILEILDEFFLA